MTDADDDPEAALRAVRLKFVTDFPAQCSALTQFIDRTADPAAADERTACASGASSTSSATARAGAP